MRYGLKISRSFTNGKQFCLIYRGSARELKSFKMKVYHVVPLTDKERQTYIFTQFTAVSVDSVIQYDIRYASKKRMFVDGVFKVRHNTESSVDRICKVRQFEFCNKIAQ